MMGMVRDCCSTAAVVDGAFANWRLNSADVARSA
jgi:hypothetical protein